MKLDELLPEVMALRPSERAQLARDLLHSLEAEQDENWEAAWAKELEKRVRDLESGAVKAVPWEEARERILARLKERRAARASSSG
ncbi:MAG TPA: addiction module protein [Polyangiaceae bacterium]|nr:addiction module protein [Polyangiaceae bacterium]